MITDEEREKRRQNSRKGGLKRVPKGIAKLPPERRREIALLGVAGRRKKQLEQAQ